MPVFSRVGGLCVLPTGIFDGISNDVILPFNNEMFFIST